MINILNYTPHDVVLCGERLPSQGLARCEQVTEVIGNIDGIPLHAKRFGAVYGLPEPIADTIYIVSAIVAQAVKGQRDDCYVVDDTVRDEQGRIIGCQALARV